MRASVVAAVALAGSVACGLAAQPFRDSLAEGMTLREALDALRTTAEERPRSWMLIHFECQRDGGSDLVMGWDKDQLSLETVETSEIASHLVGCEEIRVYVRGFRHSSSFSFVLRQDGKLGRLTPVDSAPR